MECFHCGLPIEHNNVKYSVAYQGVEQPMCCAGCHAVASAIIQNGLDAYYQYRTAMPKVGEQLIPDELNSLSVYNKPEVQSQFVAADAEIKEASLILEGIQCAACVWLNEQHLKQLPGVELATVNYASNRMRVRWNENQIQLSDILAEIIKLGYRAHPFSAQQQEHVRTQFRKKEYKRLAVAGLCAGQVMMIAVALYAGRTQGLEFASAQLLRWVSLILTIPAMMIGAWPFFQGAWRGLKHGSAGMDVPIVIGLVAGFVGSVYNTIHSSEAPVYFDTITMLIFFLLATRFLERNARERSTEAAENLLRLVPMMVSKMVNGQPQLVGLSDVEVGDILAIKPGEVIAADGVITEGESSADESLLTGESKPLVKTLGSYVYAGSTNYESPIQMQVKALGENTMLASISRLLDRAHADKPRLAVMADNIATVFTVVLLMIVMLTTLIWLWLNPARTFEVVLALLVVSCPCALSLAAPAAFAAAGAKLIQQGVLVTRGHTIETLANVTHVVLDKTGTLTQGKLQLITNHCYTPQDAQTCLQLAASLEQYSEHPIAHAILQAAKQITLLPVTNITNQVGYGLQGEIHGEQYHIGKPLENMASDSHEAARNFLDEHPTASAIYLYRQQTLLAVFVMQDTLRKDAKTLIERLHKQGLQVSLLSGDHQQAVAYVAQSLGINNWYAGMTPQDKLQQIQAMQANGDIVLMVGDGINDAPVLATAQVSIAMSEGTQMARTSGDAVLLNQQMQAIDDAILISKMGQRIMRQNFAWAIAYNIVVIPLAAFGLISPLMAAFGMSISSLIVVLNALRIKQS